MRTVGLELGATWLRGVALSPDGAAAERVRELTPENPLEAARLLKTVWRRLGGSDVIGFAAAPELGADGKVRRWPNRPGYVGANLLEPFFERRLSPLVLDDATAGSLAEHLAAAKAGAPPSSTAYISVGTGVGAGFVLGDQVWAGATGRAMDLGHIPVPATAGTPCPCGSVGCLQMGASGRHLERRARELGLPPDKVLELAEGGHEQATRLLNSLAAPLAQGIGLVERLLDPDRIILGGGLMEGDMLFHAVVDAARGLGCRAPVLKSRWGAWAGALGAALEVYRRAEPKRFGARAPEEN